MLVVCVILAIITELVGCYTSLSADLNVNSTMAISGTWMYSRDTDAEWDSALQAFKTHNGTTILAFGKRPNRTTASIARSSSLLRQCVHGSLCLSVLYIRPISNRTLSRTHSIVYMLCIMVATEQIYISALHLLKMQWMDGIVSISQSRL